MAYGATILLDIPLFRTRFAQFANVVTFTDAAITVQWVMATQFITDVNSGDLRDAARELAIQYLTAHLLALSVATAAGGGVGVVSGSTVDKVSVTLAVPPFGSDEWRFWLNTTPYGPPLLALLSAQAAGGFYYGGLPERAAFRKVGGIF